MLVNWCWSSGVADSICWLV